MAAGGDEAAAWAYARLDEDGGAGDLEAPAPRGAARCGPDLDGPGLLESAAEAAGTRSGSESEAECRICGDTVATKRNKFISPCECTGSISKVHVRCLEKWILNRPGNRAAAGDNLQCEICHAQYRVALRHRLRFDTSSLCSCSSCSHLVEACLLLLSMTLMLGILIEEPRSLVANRVAITAMAAIVVVCTSLALYRLYIRWFRTVSVPRVALLV